MTTVLEGGEVSASHPSRSLPPGKTRYPLYRRLGGPQGRSGQVRKISSPPGFDPLTVQPVASRYTDWAVWPAHIIWNVFKLLIILEFKFVNQGKFCKYIDSTHNIKSQHILLQIAHSKAGNNFTWDPIKLTFFFYYMHQHLSFFVNIGLMMNFWGWN